MAGKSPTQNSLAYLRENGYLAEVVERWNPHARVRQDLFGIIDILAVKENETLAVQCTSKSNVNARIDKIINSPVLSILRKAGWRIEVHGWSKFKNRWKITNVDIT